MKAERKTRTVVVTMTPESAALLYTVLGDIGGGGPFRQVTDNLYWALEAAGVRAVYYRGSMWTEGRSAYFNEAATVIDDSVECDNCGRRFNSAEIVWPISDPWERLEPGSEVPSGECPHCGALCYQ